MAAKIDGARPRFTDDWSAPHRDRPRLREIPRPRLRHEIPRPRLRHEVRDGLAVSGFSLAAATALTMAIRALLRLAG